MTATTMAPPRSSRYVNVGIAEHYLLERAGSGALTVAARACAAPHRPRGDL